MRAAALMGLGAGLLLACKMLNPAFKGDEEGGTDGTSEGDSEGTGADTDGGSECELEFEEPRAVRYDVEGMACDDLSEGYFAVAIGQEGFQLEGPCDDRCDGCQEGTASMGPVHDLNPGDISCWWVANEAPVSDPAADRCSFKAFTFWQAIEPLEVPLAVGSSLDYGVPESAKVAFPEFEVKTKQVEACECLPEEGCCDPADPPAKYKLEISGSYIHEGETVSLLADPWTYSFTNAQCESAGLCNEPRRIGWVMSLQP